MDLVEFKDGDRTFTCRAASSPATPGTMWWWITVTGETQRYAAFRTQSNDTERNLRPRVLAYYAQLLADRERPRELRTHWAQRRAAQKTGEGDVVAVATADAVAVVPAEVVVAAAAAAPAAARVRAKKR